MPAATPPPAPLRWTRAMLDALPDDGQRHEIIDGMHFVTPSPALLHQFVLGELYSALRSYLATEKIGWAFVAPCDIELANDTVVQPDIVVLRRAGDRPPPSWKDGGLPMLAVEIASPSSMSRDHLVKRPRYQRAGIDEYWIVNPLARLVERWLPADDRPEILAAELTWHPAEAARALTINLEPIFSAVTDLDA